MTLKNKVCYGLLILVLLLAFSMLALKSAVSTSEQEIAFEMLERGDISGYGEEAYFVVKTEANWIAIWERHTLVREPRGSLPSIDFSRNLVICAFMGRRPTTGYSIDIERIWTDGEHVFVEIAKRDPPEGLAVCQMITCPYVMILVEKTDMHFVFHVVDENGETSEYTLSEFTSAFLAIMLFAFSCATSVALRIKE